MESDLTFWGFDNGGGHFETVDATAAADDAEPSGVAVLERHRVDHVGQVDLPGAHWRRDDGFAQQRQPDRPYDRRNVSDRDDID